MTTLDLTKGFIGIDAGTSCCKTVLLGNDGRILATATQAYSTKRRVGGEVTQSADDWLEAVASTVGSCVEQAGGLSIEGLSVTAPAHNVVLVGKNKEALSRVVLWSDARPGTKVAELKRVYGDELFERTFADLGPAWTFPQLVWLRENLPREVWSQIRYILTGKDYIRYCMTEVPATDPSDAAGTAMFDQREGVWLESLCRECGLTQEHLPQIRPAFEIGGTLNDSWARRTGLKSGIPVAIGATDTAAELVSVGATDPSSSLIKIASTGTVVTVSEQPRPDRRVLTYPHAVADRWYTLAATNSAATAYQWLKDILFTSSALPSSNFYEKMDSIAGNVPPGAEGILFLPFLNGERSPYWDPGLRAAFLGISSAHGRPHLCRAVLEGVALSLRTCRDLLDELGLPIVEPFFTGGGISSKLWSTILVSVLGEPAQLCEPRGPAVGAALIARAGAQSSSEAPLTRGIELSCHTLQPRSDWQTAYDNLYETYRQTIPSLVEISHRLGKVKLPENVGDSGE